MSTHSANPPSHIENPPSVSPRIYLHGVVTWQCPQCSTVTRSRINAQSWKVTCAYQPCHRVWAIGFRLGKLRSSRNATPPDLTMPVNALYNHRSGDGVNEVFDANQPADDSNKDVLPVTQTTDKVTPNE